MNTLQYVTNLHIQQSLRGFLDISHWEKAMAVTLTMKQALGGRHYVPINEEDCTQNLRHALNLLNRKLFGNNFRRKNRRIEVIPTLELDSSGRYHYHLALNVPAHFPFLRCFFELRSIWQKTRWGHKIADFDRMRDPGWVDYITKIDSLYGYSDKIDWANLHLCNPSVV